jgi:hypothetical protein
LQRSGFVGFTITAVYHTIVIATKTERYLVLIAPREAAFAGFILISCGPASPSTPHAEEHVHIPQGPQRCCRAFFRITRAGIFVTKLHCPVKTFRFKPRCFPVSTVVRCVWDGLSWEVGIDRKTGISFFPPMRPFTWLKNDVFETANLPQISTLTASGIIQTEMIRWLFHTSISNISKSSCVWMLHSCG